MNNKDLKTGGYLMQHDTVESQYLQLGHLKFCEIQSIYLHQKHILIVISKHSLALATFLHVQITRSAN